MSELTTSGTGTPPESLHTELRALIAASRQIPYSTSAESRVFRIVRRIRVPSGTRTSGPGTLSGFPASANA